MKLNEIKDSYGRSSIILPNFVFKPYLDTDETIAHGLKEGQLIETEVRQLPHDKKILRLIKTTQSFSFFHSERIVQITAANNTFDIKVSRKYPQIVDIFQPVYGQRNLCLNVGLADF